MPAQATDNANAQKLEWLQALWRHRKMAAGVLTLGLGLCVFWTMRQPRLYRSTASVLLESSGGNIFGRAEPESLAAPDAVRINPVLAESRPVIQRIKLAGFQPPASGRGALPPGFSARVEGQLLYLAVLDPLPERAAALANAWSAAFIEEMTRRTLAPSLYATGFLKRSLPELRRDWIEKQEALSQLERQTGFDPKEIENHPIRKRLEELNSTLTRRSIVLSSLQAEERLLTAPGSGPQDWLQLPRAQTDTAITAFRRQFEERRVRVQEIRETLAPNSREVQQAERAMSGAQQSLEAAARALAVQVRTETSQVRQECEQLRALLSEAEAEYADLRSKAARHRVLSAEADMAGKLYAEMAQKENQSDLTGQYEYSYARPWEQAVASPAPHLPSWTRNLAVGLLLSIVLAAALAGWMELRDDTLRTSRQLEDHLQVAALGTIPLITQPRGKRLVMVSQAGQPALTESLRTLQLGLESARTAPLEPLTLAVTSSLPDEGKTFVCANLAEIFARLDRKVLAVDADLHRTSMTRAFDCQGAGGFYEALASGHWRRESVIKLAHCRYHFLAAGNVPAPESCHINPGRLRTFLAQARQDYDVILFDTTPVLALADACIIAAQAESTLVITRARRTRMLHLKRSVERLTAARARQLFFALNAADRAESEGYAYSEDYYGPYRIGNEP